MHKNFICFVLSAFGIGFLPLAPGTWASLAAVGLLAWLYSFDALPVLDILVFFVLLLLTVTLIIQYQKLEPQTERDRDPGFIVLDEVLGMFVALMGLPVTWITAIAGFVLFRLLDITKPLGIRRLEAIEGPWGILLDDLAAGLLVRFVLLFLVPPGI
ncbi:MAG: phosphatidylglycerophosphatase A [Candidatus Omnitrophica bacterium]|nr:phosphatidylglycerophosphatase A [Candidatus Omnitrophota bacterium]